jgi:hypothetical protein
MSTAEEKTAEKKALEAKLATAAHNVEIHCKRREALREMFKPLQAFAEAWHAGTTLVKPTLSNLRNFVTT